MCELNNLLAFKERLEERGGSLTKSQKARLFELMFNQDNVLKAQSNGNKTNQ